MAKARKEGKKNRNRRNLSRKLELIKRNTEIINKLMKELKG